MMYVDMADTEQICKLS